MCQSNTQNRTMEVLDILATSKKLEATFYKVVRISHGKWLAPYKHTRYHKYRNDSDTYDAPFDITKGISYITHRGMHVFQNKKGAEGLAKDLQDNAKFSKYVVIPVIGKKKDFISAGFDGNYRKTAVFKSMYIRKEGLDILKAATVR